MTAGAARSAQVSAVALHAAGVALQKQGRLEDAVATYDRALAADPRQAAVLYSRGSALAALKRYGEAVASYDRALVLRPDYADAHNNRGIALRALGRFEDAVASYDRALALRPDYAAAHNNRGNALQSMGRHAEAIASYDRTLAIRPDHQRALYGRAVSLRALNRHREAIAACDRVLALNSDDARTWNDRGVSLYALRRCREAVASFDRALAIRPDVASVLHNRGNALYALGRLNGAIASFRAVLAIEPGHAKALDMLAYVQGQVCDWRGRDESLRLLRERSAAGQSCSNPFVFLGLSDDPAEQLAASASYFRALHGTRRDALWRGERYEHDRIRLAYLSADFHDHATAFLMAGLFEHHDRTQFETIAISFGPKRRSAMRARLERSFGRFIDVRDRSDAEVARLMREMEVDIAVDLKGYTTDARPGILALRPAPVQVNYLGYPGTLGADCIDYIVADEFVIPPASQQHYSEQVAYVPGCYQANDTERRISDKAPTRRAAGLPDDAFVFCCFNNGYKLTPEFFDAWMRLLLRVERSVLWLLQDNPAAMRNLRGAARARGVDPARLVFAKRVGLEDHLARHRLADLFLDTLPVNAHTTASDALWAGLPLLTCAGRSFAGRVAGSLLQAVGLPELVTTRLEDYEALALRLATAPGMLREIRARLARNRDTATLFDTAGFCRHLEAAYRIMQDRQRAGAPPAAFHVASDK